jgi:hypothetical protein
VPIEPIRSSDTQYCPCCKRTRSILQFTPGKKRCFTCRGITRPVAQVTAIKVKSKTVDTI